MMKHLVKKSENYLLLVNTTEYIEYQKRFDQLYLQIKKEIQALKQLNKELIEHRTSFINKQKLHSPLKEDLIVQIDRSNTIEENIEQMNDQIENFNHTIQSYNFMSRF